MGRLPMTCSEEDLLISATSMCLGVLFTFTITGTTWERIKKDKKKQKHKFDEKADDGFFLGYSLVAKAFRVFNIRRQEMEEIVHVTFSEDDEAISQTSTEAEDHLAEFTIAEDHLAIHEPDHAESADIPESAKPQDNVLSESISYDQSAPVISPSAEVILQNLVPQDRWSREKHIEVVNAGWY
ncbi:hypothetical protein Tco_1447752 [Tanacetum coccineum]